MTAASAAVSVSEDRVGAPAVVPAEAPQLVAHEVERRGRQDGDRLSRDLLHPGDAHQQLQHDQVEAKRDQADRQEAGGLESGVPIRGLERPMPVEQEVVGDRDAEGEHCRRDVVDAGKMNQCGEHGQVDDVAGCAHDRELHQLHPVAGLRRPWPTRCGRARPGVGRAVEASLGMGVEDSRGTRARPLRCSSMSHARSPAGPGALLEHLHLDHLRRGGPDTTEVDHALNRIRLPLAERLQGAVGTVPRPSRDTFPAGLRAAACPGRRRPGPGPGRSRRRADHGARTPK